MILSFRDKISAAIFAGLRVKGVAPELQAQARRKMRLIDAAVRLDDLKSPPGNRLERLSGDRQGQMSIRVNDQWRICFVWSEAGVTDVELVDYH